MFRRTVVSSLLLIACACTTEWTARQPPPDGASASMLVLLTRGGCATTERMRTRLDDALRAMGSTLKYEVLDLDAVPESDARRGYPTPTLLYGNRDVFDLPVPQPPFPEPT